MEQAGFRPEDYEEDPVEVWPENWPAIQLFLEIDTQWRIGVNGATGLDYNPLFVLLDRRYSGDEWDQMFADIQTIERAALAAMRRKS